MECNKDEAVRAKEIAEKKLLERDISGAQKFALKAQNLFPKLDGLSQFLEIIDVYVAHEKKINGEADYYGIFGVDPFVEEEVLKKQYKRMALSLHPDKNKSVGAEGAFQILSQAWSVLSNKDYRSAYNLKMNVKAPNQTASFSSATARYTPVATNPQHLPTRPRTPTATNQQYNSVPHHPTNATCGTSSQHNPSGQQAPAAVAGSSQYNPSGQQAPAAAVAGSFQHYPRGQQSPAVAGGSRYSAAPQPTPDISAKYMTAANSQYDPAACQPVYPTPGSSSLHIPSYQKAPATAMESKFIPVPLRPRNPAPSTHNQYSPTGNPQLIPKYQKTPTPATAARNQPTSSLSPLRTETFWTSCNTCRIQYEYQKIFLNQNLLCPHCKQPFLAKEIPAPNVSSRISRPRPFPHQPQDMSAASSGSKGEPASAPTISEAASRQLCMERLKKRFGEAVNMARDKESLMKNDSTVPEKMETASPSDAVSTGLNREKSLKKRRTDGPNSAKKGSQGAAAGRSGLKKTSVDLKGNLGAEQQSRSVKELSQTEIHGMLMVKARMEIIGRLNEGGTEKSKSSNTKRVERKDSVNASKNDSINYMRTEQSKDGLFSDTMKTSQIQKSSTLKDTDDIDANPDETVSMIVPDANFHNFDDDRIEESFAEHQVWAAYDDDDGMPRYYALVHQVISRKPFKIQISWLNSKSSSEFGSLDWIGCGFTKTTGDFRVGKSVVNKRLNSFSHPVKFQKGARGAIKIIPRKGDVWALYRNWSPHWDEVTADEVIHKYDLVVVLEDYNEDEGVLVAPLVKVAGFTSVFNQLLDEKDIWTIPREEMFRFSHEVPFYMVDGLEAENAPKGCYELDPAALPLELLKVITDAEAAEEKTSEEAVVFKRCEVGNEPRAESSNAGKAHATEESGNVEDTKHVLTYSRKNKGRKMEVDADQFQG
ncbi:Chaperone protein DnaJ [Sesamum alatum]|uniref:Chaperone protein DnaJ n=1 Tax=Sesamum alatum TaxID=300844 RepID=A0AAE1YVE7_9LAMI|nr:Chaperone protein DnaJ [Sesamum alatum]